MKTLTVMNKFLSRLLLLMLLVVSPVLAMGEDGGAMHRVLFRSGRVVVGEIVLRNDEVVIVKDSYGARFQFPMADISEITEIKEEEPEHTESAKASRSISNAKRTSLGFRVAGGVAAVDGSVGGALAADLRMGANNIAGRRIFLGGQVGYRALMAEGKTLSVIPIDAVMELPLMQADHVPMLGANIGYGIGIGGIRGGVNAGLSLAYRYHFSRTGAFHVGVNAEVQQLSSAAHMVTVEPGQTYASTGGRTAVMGMITLGVLF